MLWRNMGKICFDRVLACILLILLSPVCLVVMVAIRIFLGSPVVFRQQRPGKDEHIFTLYKFRTMTHAYDLDGNLLSDSDRLQGVGKWIRAFSLDEIPQLYNILRGEMSFVGPRPLLVEYLPLYDSTQRRRHSVLPGITGWAQVNGRNGIGWREKFSLDVWYVENQSFWLDMRIIWMTTIKVLRRDGISQTGHVTMEKFTGEN
jgi:undecaprenyl phosphate N,N'-diacetylbacillosamine 1-phosphate transferase